MHKAQMPFGLALLALVTLATAAQATVVVTYDPSTGNIGFNGNGTLVTSFELKSASSQLIPSGVNPGVISGPFDVLTPAKFFKLVTEGVGSVDIGPILPPGLTCDALLADLSIAGSIKPAGNLHDAPGGVFLCPEPSSAVLGGCGLLCLLGLPRKHA
jgi:hypothetical protein